jgi:hypothetical protein
MASLTPTKLKNLRNFLTAKPDHEVLRLYLQKSNNDVRALQHGMLVCLHRNWSEHPPYHLISLGITTYDRLSVNRGQPIMPGPHAETLLRHVWSLHLILRAHAHLEPSPSTLSAYHFGTTVYVSQEEALHLLCEIWHQPMDSHNAAKGNRPIVYLSFGNNDGVAKTRKTAFDFDPAVFPTTVATLNAQIIPQQTKITRHADASFEYLLPQFQLPIFHPGNAGNAAMYSTIIAVLSTLRFEVYGGPDNAVAKPGRTGQSRFKSAEAVLQGLMEWPTPAPPVGVNAFCWRCGSSEHGFAKCGNVDLRCGRCEGSGQVWRRENAGSHVEGGCVFK